MLPHNRQNNPDSEVHGNKHGAQLGPTGPRWAPCWPRERCYLGRICIRCMWITCYLEIVRFGRRSGSQSVSKTNESQLVSIWRPFLYHLLKYDCRYVYSSIRATFIIIAKFRSEQSYFTPCFNADFLANTCLEWDHCLANLFWCKGPMINCLYFSEEPPTTEPPTPEPTAG